MDPCLRRPLLAARPARARVGARPEAREYPRIRRRLGRGPLDPSRGDRAVRAGADARRRALRALLLAPEGVLLGQGHRGPPQPVRRARGEARMSPRETAVAESAVAVEDAPEPEPKAEEELRPPATLVIF